MCAERLYQTPISVLPTSHLSPVKGGLEGSKERECIHIPHARLSSSDRVLAEAHIIITVDLGEKETHLYKLGRMGREAKENVAVGELTLYTFSGGTSHIGCKVLT